MARFARMLRGMGKRVRTLLPLAEKRAMAAAFSTPATASGCGWQGQLGDPLCRWQCHPCPPTCGRGKKGELASACESEAIAQVQQREALGWSKGGFSTKIHLRCDGNGLPITFLLTVGERHEAVVFEQLMEQGAMKRTASGRPRLRPHRVGADKGYSSGKIRAYLRRRGIRITIPRKENERHRGKFDKALYRQRNWVERCFNRLKQFRRIATRYEKKAENYLSILTLASIMMWL